MDELTLRDHVRVLFEKKWVIILTMITAAGAVKLGLLMKTPKYEAKVKMLVSAQKVVEAPYYLQLMQTQGGSAAATQAEIVKSNPVLERALSVIGFKPFDYEKRFAHRLRKIMIDRKLERMYENFAKHNVNEQQKQAFQYRSALEDLRNNISVEPISNTTMFTISYKDYSPIAAAAIANIVSRSYVIFDLEQQLAELQIKYGEKNLAVTQLRDSIERMTKNLNGEPIPDVEAIGPASVKIIEQAMVPVSPSGPPESTMLLIALIGSFILGVILAFLMDYFDEKFKIPQEVESLLKYRCIGSIPKRASPEAYRKIADKISFEMKEKSIRTILVVSSVPREGVSTVTSHLASTLCLKPDCKVLAIDGNMKKPTLHKKFKISNAVGLADLMDGTTTVDKAIIEVDDCLSVLPMGNLDFKRSYHLEGKTIESIFEYASQDYDVVIIDGANLRESKYSLQWAHYVESVLVVVDTGRTKKKVVKQELMSLNGRSNNILGVVMNNRIFAIPSIIYKRI
jgi:capsular exopolysaccharide synthesis family protein